MGDEVLPEGFAVIGCGLETEDDLLQLMLRLQRVCVEAERLEAFFGVVDDEPLEKGFPIAVPKKAWWRSLAMSMSTARYSRDPLISALS
jgi:hypothetical protein